jgi:MFS family permease
LFTLFFIADVVVSTLAPEGADPAASAAASVGSSLRQQSSQSAHSGRSRARSRAGSSTRSRARSTIEEEVTAEQKLGKAIGLNMLLSSLAVIAGSLLTAAIAFHLPESFVPTWFIMSVPCIAAVLLACFAPETLATKVQSDDSSEEGVAEVRRVPIRSERSESFSLISFMDESGNNDCDDNFSLMMDNEEHNDNQDQEDQEDQEDAVKDRTEEDDDEKEPPSAPTCSKEWCRSSLFGFLIFLSENRPLAYVAAFLFLIGMQLASTEDLVAFMSLDLCLSPSTITIIGPIQSRKYCRCRLSC